MSNGDYLSFPDAVAYIRSHYGVTSYYMKLKVLCAEGKLEMVQFLGEHLKLTRKSIDALYGPIVKKAAGQEQVA